MTYRSVSRLVGWVIALAGLGVLVWIVAKSDLDYADVNVTAATAGVLLSAQGGYLVTESLRMQVILERAADGVFGVVHMFRVFVLSRMLNLAIPQSGNVYRIAEIKTRYNAAITESTGGVLTFAWLSVSLSLIAATALTTLGVGSSDDTVQWPLLLGLTIVVIAIPIGVMALSRYLGHSGAFIGRLRRLALSPIPVLRDRATLLRFTALWAASVAIIVAMYSATFAMVGPVPPIGALIALYALIQATSFVVITPGNIGIQDLGFATIAVWFGSDAATASAAALIVRISGVLVTSLAAVIIVGIKAGAESSD